MRTQVQSEQLRLRKEPDEMHVVGNAEPGRKHLQLGLQRALAGNEEFGIWKISFENREGAQTRGHAFFWNQPARLHDSPAAIWWCLSFHQRKFIQRNTGAVDSQFFARTTKLHESIGERLRAGEHERHRVE